MQINFNLFNKFLQPLKITLNNHIKYTHYINPDELIKLKYDVDDSTRYLLNQIKPVSNR